MEKKLTLRERFFGKANVTTEAVVPNPQSNNDNDFVIKHRDYTKKQLINLDANSLDERGLFDLYNRMDQDAVVSAALDLLADNATLINSKTGHVISVESSDQQFAEELNDFLQNVVKIDTEAWEYIRSLIKYGSLYLDTKASNGGTEWSFIETANPFNIKALTYGQDKVKYYAVKPDDAYNTPTVGQNPFQFNLQKSLSSNGEYNLFEKDRYISAFNSRKHLGKMEVKTTTPIGDDSVDGSEELYVRTGKSVLASVVDTWQMLMLLEDQLVTYRLAKSNVFKLVQVNVEGSTNQQAEQIMKAVSDSFKASESFNANTNTYTNRQSPVPYNDFVYVPVKGAKGSVTVQAVGDQIGTIDLSDIDYFNNKLFAGLGVLKAYLGREESTPGGLGDSTLTKLDERMSKRVKRLQQILKHIVTQIIEYYWLYSKVSRNHANMPDYKLIVGEVSSSEDTERLERLQTSLDVADRVLAITDDERMSAFVNNEKLFNYVFSTLLNIDTSNIDNTVVPERVEIKTINKIKETRGGKILEAVKKSKVIREDKSPLLEGNLHDILYHSDIERLIEEYDIELVSPYSHKRIPLHEALESNSFKKSINEKSYKDLKSLTKSKDPIRVAKAKKLVIKYNGLTTDNLISFQVTAENPQLNARQGKPTSYTVKVSLKDLATVLLDAQVTDLSDSKAIQQAMQGNVAVSCECPAATYWGQEYNGTKADYSLVTNDIAPTRNLPTQVVCKHTLAALEVLPFWWNTILRDLRANGTIPSKEQIKLDKQKELDNIKASEKPAEKEIENADSKEVKKQEELDAIKDTTEIDELEQQEELDALEKAEEV